MDPGCPVLLASTSWRCFFGCLVNASVLPAAEADARAFGFPFDAPVRLPSGDDSCGRARAREHLVTGESHGRAAELRNEATVVGEFVVQRLVRVLGPGPGRPGARAFKDGELTVDLPCPGRDPVLLHVQDEHRRGG